MSDPFIGEVSIFAGNFAPRGWAHCNGQLLDIAQNTAMFAILGTTYGGDGRTTFGLPNLQGRAPMHPGNGPGLASRRLGQIGGTATENLSQSQMPSHSHTMRGNNDLGEDSDPNNRVLARGGGSLPYQSNTTGNLVDMADESLPPAGGAGTPSHTNEQPYLSLCFIIALQGIFPSRN